MAKKELPVINAPRANGNAVKTSLSYDCTKCPAYCCTYDWILVTKRDIARLAKRFELSYEEAEKKFTKFIKSYGHRVLRRHKDHVFPEEERCGYYDFLTWERQHQDDESFIPLQQ